MVANGSTIWTMTPSKLPKLWQKWLKDNKVKVLEWPSQSSDLKHIENVWVELKKPDSVTPALSGGMGQNSPNLLWEACGRLSGMFDPS